MSVSVPRTFPSLKRYLARTVESLERLRAARTYEWNYSLSPFEELVIVLEDRRFLRHRGLDWRSAARELLKALALRRHGGASTIEMQYVRTVTGRYERTLRRKCQEVVLSFLVDYHLDKVTILRSYLRVAYFGTRVRGAESAAMRAFGKRLGDLKLEEAAWLAALLVYPIPRNPSEKWAAKVKRRAEYGLRLRARLHESLQQPTQ